MSFTDFREVGNPVAGTAIKYGSQDLLDIMQIFNGKVVGTKRPHILNQWLWDNSFDMKEITVEPAAPTAGNQRLFVDSTTHHLKMKDSTSTVTDLQISATSSNLAFDYFIYIESSTYKAKNGTTGAVDYTSTTDAGAVINSAINALPNGGLILIDSGIYLIRTTIAMQNKIKMKGFGETTVLKLDNTQNKDVISSGSGAQSFATLTGSGTSGTASGPYSCYIEDLQIDGNKANNATGGWGVRYYGYDWHFHRVHILNCKSGGLWSEWSTNPVCPQTFVCMESFYDIMRIQNCEGSGWTNRGPHDSQAGDVIIHTINNGNGYTQQFLANKYDGSCYMANCHIYDIQSTGTIAADIQGGTLTFVNLTTESTPSGSGIGLKTSSTGIVRGSQYWTYLNDTGIQLNTSGNLLSSVYITNNRVKGVEVIGNDNYLAGIAWNTTNAGAGTNIVMGSAGTSVAANMVHIKTAGAPTAMMNWANAANSGNIITLDVYTDSTNATAVTGSPNFATNTIMIEHLATGTSVKYIDAKPAVLTQVTKNPFYRKYGWYQVGITEQAAGILSGVDLTGTATFASDSFQGRTASKDTGITANSRAGINAAASGMVALTCRRLNPTIKAHIKFASTASARGYFGFSTATVIPGSDTPLASTDKGVLIGFRSTDTNFQVFNNDGTAAEVVTSAGVAMNTNYHTFEIRGDDSTPKFTAYVDGTLVATLTTRIPGQTDALVPYCVVENSTTTAKQIIIDALTLEEDFIP